ncbi:hypothetical protein COOONC_15771, partial [Cooperia oncophora]
MERVDGSVYVRFCLEHAGHTPSDQMRMSPRASRMRRKRSNLKRSSQSLSDSGADMTEDTLITTPLTVIKDAEMMCTDVIEDNNNVNRLKKGEVAPDIEFDTSALNSQITQRLDSTTDRLKVITQ